MVSVKSGVRPIRFTAGGAFTDKLFIKGARIVDPANGTCLTGDILTDGGKIIKTGGNIECGGAIEINAEGLSAAPGLVDMHVHLRDPGFTEKEDILSGCRAAAAGGVTSLLCMPNTNPVLDSGKAIKYVLDKAKTSSANVYAAGTVTKGLRGDKLSDLCELKKAGAVAVSDDGRPVVSTETMARAIKAAPEIGLKVLAHCEDMYLSAGGKINEGAVSKLLGIKGVPAAAEECGTAREVMLAASYGVPIHICHVSTAKSVEMIRTAKKHGIKVTCETAPHYFALTEKELLKQDADYRMSPPLRTESDRMAVIEGLEDGTIDAIATDHAPHTPEEKSDFLTAPNGVIGMETSLAAGITFLVKPGYITLDKLIWLMSFSPARILGINAGTLSIGSPADIVLFDPEKEWTVDVSKLHGKSRNAVFKGRKLKGKVKMTVCRGEIVYKDGV